MARQEAKADEEEEEEFRLKVGELVAAQTKMAEKNAAVVADGKARAAEANKITLGQEPTHTLHKDIYICIICFIPCM